MLYNKVLRGLEDEVVFHLEGEGKGEDKDSLLNNLQILTRTILTDFSEQSSEKTEVVFNMVPSKYQELLLF